MINFIASRPHMDAFPTSWKGIAPLVLSVRLCARLGAGDLRARGLSTYVTQAELAHRRRHLGACPGSIALWPLKRKVLGTLVLPPQTIACHRRWHHRDNHQRRHWGGDSLGRNRVVQKGLRRLPIGAARLTATICSATSAAAPTPQCWHWL